MMRPDADLKLSVAFVREATRVLLARPCHVKMGVDERREYMRRACAQLAEVSRESLASTQPVQCRSSRTLARSDSHGHSDGSTR